MKLFNHLKSLKFASILWIPVGLVAVVYLVGLLTPLRLNTDASDFLQMLFSAQKGEGFYPTLATKRYPPGYPAMLLPLAYAGVANSSTFVGVNLIWLTIGLICSHTVIRSRFRSDLWIAPLIVLLSLFSFTIIKHVTLPVSDVPYLGIGFASLIACTQAEKSFGKHRFVWLVVATILIMAAIVVRSIGVTLLLALIWSALGGSEGVRRLAAKAQSIHLTKWIIIVLAMVAGIALTILVRHVVYLQQFIDGLIAGELPIVWFGRLIEYGELTINWPISRSPKLLEAFFPLIGLVTAVILVYGLWTRRKQFDSLDIYLCAYSALLWFWPFNDNRFWLPIVPLMLLTALHALTRLMTLGFPRIILITVLLIYLCSGIFALAYSTRLSLAGKHFADIYGSPDMHPTYRAAFGMASVDRKEMSISEQNLLMLLCHYEIRVPANSSQCVQQPRVFPKH